MKFIRLIAFTMGSLSRGPSQVRWQAAQVETSR